MKVSIIIPLFNQAEFAAQSIESALDQTWLDREIIVVNDGSTDDSQAVAERYLPRIKLVNSSNRGPGGARNVGLLNSNGRMILPLDGDDWIEPDFLEKTVPLMTPKIGVVSSDWAMFGVESRDVVTPVPSLMMMMQANHLPCCSLIRRQAIVEVGGYNPRMEIYEDWNLWIDILKRGWETAVVHKALFHYRRRFDSTISASNGHHEELYEKIRSLHRDIFS